MADNEVPITITVDDKAATKSLNSFEKSAVKSTEAIEKSFATLKNVALAAVAVFAGKAVLGGLESIIEAASESDQAVRKLGVALASTGEFSDQAVEDFEQFASALQKTTQYTDEAVLGSVALAKNFGLTNEEAKKLTQAAIDLAAATGTDLNTATEQLGATFSGTTGRLGKTIPALKSLTEEELKAGAAIDIVAQKFQGFAEATSQTFGGAVTQTKNAFGEIFESLGKIVTQNPVVLKVVQELGNAFRSIAEIIDKNRDSISEFLSAALKKIVSFIPSVIKAINILVQGFGGFLQIIALVIDGMIELGRIILAISRPLIELAIAIGSDIVAAFSDFLAFIVSVAKAVPGVSSTFKDLGINLDEVQKSLEGVQKTAESLDVESAANEFDEFANDALIATTGFVDSAKKVVKTTTEFAGSALTKLENVATETSASINKVNDSSVKATTGIKNMNNELKKTANTAAELERVKGSFDKVKTSIEELQKEIDKQTLSASQQIDAELKRGRVLEENAKRELELTGKATKENLALLGTFDALIQKKADLAKEKLSIGDLSFAEATANIAAGLSSISDAVAKLGDTSIDTTSLANVGLAIGKGIVDTVDQQITTLGEKFSKATLGDIVTGIGTAFSVAGQTVAGILSGQFVQDGLTVAQGFAEFPKQILSVFENADQIFQSILDELPGILDKLISSLPELAKSLANTLGEILTKIIDRLPEILDSILSSLGTLVEKLFSDIIPRLIQSLPTIFKKILDALPGILNSILKALPTIITEIFKAIPQIIKAIVDAIPGIIEVLLENLPDIVLAFVEGFINLMPEIVDALVTSLLIDGGLERIIVALVKAMPRVALALVQGVVRGIASAALTIGHTIGKGLTAAIGNIGGKIGGDFGNKVKLAFQSIFSGLQNIFAVSTGNLFANITGAFSQGGAGIIRAFKDSIDNVNRSIISAFQSAAGFIVAAFDSAYQTVKLAVERGANAIADKVREGAQAILEKIREAAGSITEAIKKPFDDLISEIKNLIDNIKNLGGAFGNGGGNGVLGELGRGDVGSAAHQASGGVIPDFALGGTVRKVPAGFPNDTFRANLTSGELNIDRTDSERLSRFLDREQNAPRGTDNAVTNALLSQIIQLLSQPINTSSTVTVDGRAFANIILDLSRNNARLSA